MLEWASGNYDCPVKTQKVRYRHQEFNMFLTVNTSESGLFATQEVSDRLRAYPSRGYKPLGHNTDNYDLQAVSRKPH